MPKRFAVLIALISASCFAQNSSYYVDHDSKYYRPCGEKIRAYYPSLSVSQFEALLKQCINSNEYEERKAKSRASDNEFNSLQAKVAAYDKLKALDAKKRAEGIAEKDIDACLNMNMKGNDMNYGAALVCMDALQK